MKFKIYANNKKLIPIIFGIVIISITGYHLAFADTTPTSLRLPANSFPTETQIPLQWTAPTTNTGLTGYKIERAGQTSPGVFGSFTTVVANTGNTGTTFTDTGLTAGNAFKYQVSAIISGVTNSPSAPFIIGTLFPQGQLQGTTNFGSGSSFTGGQTFGSNVQFGSGSSFTGVQTFSGANTFGANTIFGAPQTFGTTQVFGDGTQFAAHQNFANTQTFGANTVFGVGTMFPPNQQFATFQNFGANQQFADGVKFLAPDQSFTGAQTFGKSMQFPSGASFDTPQTFGDKTVFAGSPVLTGANTFGKGTQFAFQTNFPAGQTFNDGTKFPDSQSFTAAENFAKFTKFGASTTFTVPQTFAEAPVFDTYTALTAPFPSSQQITNFGQFAAFGKNVDFSNLPTQTFPAGVQFDTGVKFKSGQALPTGAVPSFGILLGPVTCGTGSDASSCIPTDTTKFLAPGKVAGFATDPAAVTHALTAAAPTFSIPGLGVTLTFNTVSGDGEASVDVLKPDPATTSQLTGLTIPTTPKFGATNDGKLTIPVGGANFENVGSVMEVSTPTATVSGTIQVTLPYDNTGMTPSQESHLKLLHKVSGVWQPESGCTVDTANKKITCNVSSLSPFVPASDGSTGSSTGTSSAPSLSGSAYAQNEYPLSIAGNSFALPNFANTITTNVVQTGQPVPIKLLLYSKNGPSTVQHVTLFANLNGISREAVDSDTRISYDANQPLEIIDPHGLFSNVSVNATPVNDKLQVEFTVTFAKAMPTSDVIIRSWDTSRHSSDVHVANAIQVVENAATSSALINTQSNAPSVNVTPAPSATQPSVTENPTGQASSNSDLMSAVKDWGGYSPNPITDSQLLQDVGLQGSHIPSWMSNNARWVADGSVSAQEFVDALKYLNEKGIIK